MSQSTDKLTCVFQFSIVGTSGLAIILLHCWHRFLIETWFLTINFSNTPTVAIL